MNVFDVWTMEYGEAESDTKGGRKKKAWKKGRFDFAPLRKEPVWP